MFINKSIMFGLFTILFFTFILGKEKPVLILVSFDGFRYDYTEYVDTPNFDFLEKNGIKSRSLKPVFPSFTFPNHYSIVTGCYANKHGILGNTFYDVKRKEFYSYKNSGTVQDGSWYGAEPIWVTAQKNSLKTATYFWIGSEAEINGYRPNIYKNFIPLVNPYEKVDEAMDWLNLPEFERPDLVLLYFDEPDHSAHTYGSTAKETMKQVKKSDEVLGYLLNSLNDIDEDFNLIIVSDHGMTDVHEDKVININMHINTDEINIFGKGPLVILRNKNDDSDAVFEIKNPNITIYDEKNIPEHFHYKNYNFPDFLLLANKGYMINPYKEQIDSLPIVGMHGYDPNIMEMHGIFYAYGQKFNKNMKIDTFELIHIYPLICKILDIKPYLNIDGRLEVLENILN